jgi:hypothetical protein
MSNLQGHVPGYGSPSPAESSADAVDPLLTITFAVLILWPGTHYGPIPLAGYVSRSPVWTWLVSFCQVYPIHSLTDMSGNSINIYIVSFLMKCILAGINLINHKHYEEID